MNDIARYERLVVTLSPGLLRYFISRAKSSDDAADLLADTFLVLWRRLPDAPANDTEAKLWLYGVAARTLAQHRRASLRRDALRSRLVLHLRRDDAAATEDSPVLEALSALDPLDQEIIRLVHWDGFALAEVATLLGKPAGTIRSRHHRARELLRRQISASRPSPAVGAVRGEGLNRRRS